MGSVEEHIAVKNFREYLRIKTVHPNPDYETAITWLQKQANDLNLKFNIVRFPKPGEFAVWLTWLGKDPSLKSILLNSHIDVVPVEEGKWTKDPFGAEKDERGNIYARGSQDMKCVGVQYLEAIRCLQKKKIQPLRTVHVSFVPDEEVGGFKGMHMFVKTDEFKNLNVGFALDEGIANPTEHFDVFYGERAIWQFRVIAKGNTGHGSILHENTAAEKIHYVMDKMLALRKKEKDKFNKQNLNLGQITSINMTMLSVILYRYPMEGGLQPNVVPPELSAVFDMRITPNWKLDEVMQFLKSLCQEAGEDVTIDFIQKSMITNQTKLDDSNVWWLQFKSVCDAQKMKLEKKIFPAATDIRYIRQFDIPAIGFSPMNKTPILLHDHDEFLNESVYLRGVEIYESLIEAITSVPKSKAA